VPEVPFNVVLDDAASVLAVSGEVDEVAAGELRTAIEKHSDGFTAPLAVDLSDVTYLPSAAVGVLATARQRSTTSGATLELVAADGSIAQRVLAVCALPYRSA
jgi:anti-anti-sigma factor